MTARDLVDQHYRNVSTGNGGADREIFSPDVETVDPGAGRLQGIDAFLAYERGFHDAFPDGRLELKSAVESGNQIAVQGVFSGTHTGPLAGPAGEIPPTNRTLALPFSDFFEVENGRITRHQMYYDQVTFLAQLGLMPAPDPVEA